jgi:hypothetical protein
MNAGNYGKPRRKQRRIATALLNELIVPAVA